MDAMAMFTASLAALVFALGACVGGRGATTIVTGAPLPETARSVWVVGIAHNAKLGAVVQAGEHELYCGGRPEWPFDIAGRPVVMAGTVTRRSTPALAVGPQGERSAGAEGAAWMLSPCAAPTAQDSGELLEAEQALFAAIAQRDPKQLSRLLAPEMILRIPGQPDVDRAGFLRVVASIPGEVLGVTGEQLRGYVTGDTGVVQGIQVARVRTEGNVIDDRGAFVDVFIKRDGVWQLTFALNVSLGTSRAQ
jgi:Domain of unknown function (DUF4440)